MQMVERPWGVAAYGAASVKALPDLVSPDSFQGTALGADAFGGVSDAAVERSRLDLKTVWAFPSGTRTFVGHQCQATFAVESTDLDDVERLLVDLVAAGANEIEAVDFDVIAKRDLRAEARRKAVAAARSKAELYAEAAGVRLGALVHIDDVDPDQVGVERYRSHSSVPGTASDQDLAPGHVVVSAGVMLGFALGRE
jgi:uncharacterized protein YggE